MDKNKNPFRNEYDSSDYSYDGMMKSDNDHYDPFQYGYEDFSLNSEVIEQ